MEPTILIIDRWIRKQGQCLFTHHLFTGKSEIQRQGKGRSPGRKRKDFQWLRHRIILIWRHRIFSPCSIEQKPSKWAFMWSRRTTNDRQRESQERNITRSRTTGTL